ncbi:MMPL family transporter [Verrucomicrobia bacterium]|nr:MMPL family transporter [Verrucomicrobiota bacterium]
MGYEGGQHKFIERILRSLAGAIYRHPRAFFFPPLILAVVCIVITVFGLEIQQGRSDLVDADELYHQKFLEYKQEFSATDDIVVLVESGSMEKNRQFVERLAGRLVEEQNLFTNVFFKGDLKLMGKKALLFVPEDKLQTMSDRLEDFLPFVEKFTQSTNLNSLFQMVNFQFIQAGKGETNGVGALLDGLPALERLVSTTMEAVERPGMPVSPGVTALFDSGKEAERGQYLTFDEGRIYLVTVRSPEKKLTGKTIRRLRELVEAVRGEVSGVNAGVTGEPVLEIDEMLQAQKDTTKAAIVALLIVALIFMYSYDETGRPLKATVCLLVGICYTMGFTTLVVGHLNILTITFAPILIGLAIDFGVHLITRFEEELRGGKNQLEALQIAMSHTGVGIFTSGLTTAGAFLAMAFTDFKGVREMGIIAGGGLLLSLIPMMIMLPVLLIRGKQNAFDCHRTEEKKEKRGARIEEMWLKRPGLVVAVGLVLTALSATQFRKVQFDYNLLHLQTAGLPAVEYEHKLMDRAGKSLLFGAVTASNLTQAVELREQLLDLPTVATVESVAPYLTEDPTGKLRIISDIKSTLAPLQFPPMDIDPVKVPELSLTLYSLIGYLGQALGHLEMQPDQKELKVNLTSLRNHLIDLRKIINDQNRSHVVKKLTTYQQSFFDDLQSTFQAIRGQDATEGLKVEDIPDAIRNRLVGKTGKILLQVYPAEDVWDRKNQERFVADLRSVLPEATGTPVQLLEYTTLLKNSYVEAAFYALGAIIILVFIHFRSISCVLLSLLPVSVGVCWSVGVMGLLGIPFNPANIMTIPLVIGIGVTSGIHILSRFAEENNPRILGKSTGKAVMVSALTTMAGFGSLTLASHQGIESLGYVMTIGVGGCMVASLTFFTALLTLLSDKGWKV